MQKQSGFACRTIIDGNTEFISRNRVAIADDFLVS
jgi:hypothetical protein